VRDIQLLSQPAPAELPRHQLLEREL